MVLQVEASRCKILYSNVTFTLILIPILLQKNIYRHKTIFLRKNYTIKIHIITQTKILSKLDEHLFQQNYNNIYEHFELITHQRYKDNFNFFKSKKLSLFQNSLHFPSLPKLNQNQ